MIGSFAPRRLIPFSAAASPGGWDSTPRAPGDCFPHVILDSQLIHNRLRFAVDNSDAGRMSNAARSRGQNEARP
jgi:hypothetical protein